SQINEAQAVADPFFRALPLPTGGAFEFQTPSVPNRACFARSMFRGGPCSYDVAHPRNQRDRHGVRRRIFGKPEHDSVRVLVPAHTCSRGGNGPLLQFALNVIVGLLDRIGSRTYVLRQTGNTPW